MKIEDVPTGGSEKDHKHYVGIVGFFPKEEVLGPCAVEGCKGQVIRYTADVQPLGSETRTPHSWQSCTLCQNTFALKKEV